MLPFFFVRIARGHPLYDDDSDDRDSYRLDMHRGQYRDEDEVEYGNDSEYENDSGEEVEGYYEGHAHYYERESMYGLPESAWETDSEAENKDYGPYEGWDGNADEGGFLSASLEFD